MDISKQLAIGMGHTHFLPVISVFILSITLVNASTAITRDETPTTISSSVVEGKLCSFELSFSEAVEKVKVLGCAPVLKYNYPE